MESTNRDDENTMPRLLAYIATGVLVLAIALAIVSNVAIYMSHKKNNEIMTIKKEIFDGSIRKK